MPSSSDNKNRIIIKRSYFDNIKTAIDSMNNFFSSNFKNKNFPTVDAEFQVDGTIMNILSWLNNVEPTWIDDVSKIENVLSSLNEVTENMEGDIYESIVNSNNKVILDYINAFVGYKVLQFIADNFEAFGQFVNGIYTFELYINPSKFRNVIDIFSQPVPIDEIEDIMGENTYTLFDATKYVTGVFNNEQITMPEKLILDNEITRFENRSDIDVEVVIDESVQEAAEVNYFEDTTPSHIKYDNKKDKWVISKQLEKAVNDLVSELDKCDTTEDLLEYFNDSNKSKKASIDLILSTVVPCIYSRVLNNSSKSHDQFDKSLLKPYIESYNSIMSKNNGALRFKNYDLFSTFKADKEGTIKFIKDFLKLNLVNDEKCVIQNNTLLTLFNIFDSRIYLDILYNVLPDDVKKTKYQTEDSFVKSIRARINSNSRAVNVYKNDNNPSTGNNTPTSKDVVEYAIGCFDDLGDMSITDMQYCEQYRDAVVSEINCLGDIMYNKGTSQIVIDNYIGESYNKQIQESYVQEQEMGDIPDYMKTRINLSDEAGTKPNVTTTDVQLPPDCPTNPIDDLADSIDAKLQASGGLDDMLGVGYNNNPNKNHQEGRIVYNITNNYNNSFNRDSNNRTSNISNDLSTGKTETISTTHTNSHNDSSKNKNTDYSSRKSINKGVRGANNNNNSNETVDTNDSSNASKDNNQTFSNGLTVQEMFTFLESEEPLSNGNGAGKPPKGDLLTTAMDADRATLSAQQGAKRTTQKVVNTGKAILKPVKRTKMWLTKIIDSLIKRDEDKVKAEIIENPSYRTALYKAMRIALKLGLTGVCFTINGYLGAAYLTIEGAKLADKHRLKKEVQEEFTTELEILNDKIKKADEEDTPESRKAKWQMMRLRSKMQRMAVQSTKTHVKDPRYDY